MNELLAALRARGVSLNLWYAARHYAGHGFQRDYADSVARARIVGWARPNVTALWRAIWRRDERWLIVGWSNGTTRVLIVVLALLRRPFGFYMDLPDAEAQRGRVSRFLRAVYFRLISRSGVFFVVGKLAVRYLAERGVAAAAIHNLPIPVAVPADLALLRERRGSIRTRYRIPASALLLASGSRLTHAKGYDLVLRALAGLTAAEREYVRFVLVGRGPERSLLEPLAHELRVDDLVRFDDWLEADDFLALLAAADVVLHPARFDAYGAATLLAVGVGVPVIASSTAGAAVEMIVDGLNGFLYDPEDVNALSARIRYFVEHPEASSRMGRAHASIAEQLRPNILAAQLMEALR